MSKLQDARKAKGISQRGLAESTGISIRTVQHYEQGSNDINSAKLLTLLKICSALQCHLEDILDDTETLSLLQSCNEQLCG